MIPRLAFRNIFRHTTRSVITLCAMTVGCTSLIFVGGFFADVLGKMRESYIHAHTGHLQLFRQGFLAHGRSAPFDYLIEHPKELMPLIEGVEGVAVVTQRLELAGLLSTGETTIACLGQGIEPRHERTVTLADAAGARKGLLSGAVLEAGQGLADDGSFEVILGKGLAEGIGARPGDSLILVTQTAHGAMNALDVAVRGNFYTSFKAFDDYALRLPLPLAQRLLQTEGVQSLVVLLERTEETHRVASAVKRLIEARHLELEIKTWEELNDFYVKTEVLFSRMFFILKLVIALVVLLSISNTMSMAVLERTTEIGTIMAMGTTRRQVIQLFLWEGLWLGLIGGTIGVVAGGAVTQLIHQIGIPMPPPPGATMHWVSEPLPVPSTMAFAWGLSLITAALSSLQPAAKASSLEIAQALRHAS